MKRRVAVLIFISLVFIWQNSFATKVYRNIKHGYEIRLSDDWVKDTGDEDTDVTYFNEKKGLIFDTRVVDTSLTEKELDDFCFFISMAYREKEGRIIVSHGVEYMPDSGKRICYILTKTPDGKYVCAEAFIAGKPNSFVLRVLVKAKRQDQAMKALKEIAPTFRLISSTGKEVRRAKEEPRKTAPLSSIHRQDKRSFKIAGTRTFSFFVPADFSDPLISDSDDPSQDKVGSLYKKDGLVIKLSQENYLFFPQGTSLAMLWEKDQKELKMIRSELSEVKTEGDISLDNGRSKGLLVSYYEKNNRYALPVNNFVMKLYFTLPSDDEEALFSSIILEGLIDKDNEEKLVRRIDEIFGIILDSFKFVPATQRVKSEPNPQPSGRAELAIKLDKNPGKVTDEEVAKPQRYFHSREHMYSIRIPDGWEEADSSLVEGSDVVLINRGKKVVGGTQYVVEQSPTTFDEYFNLLYSAFSKDDKIMVRSRKKVFMDGPGRYCGLLTLVWKGQEHVRTVAIIPYSRKGKGNKYLMVTVSAGKSNMYKETMDSVLELVYGLKFMEEGREHTGKSSSQRISEIYNIKFGTDVRNGRLIGETKTFSPGTRKVHIWFNLKGIPEGSELSSVWYYLGRKEPQKIIQSEPVLVSRQVDYGEFSFELAKNKIWPEGMYRVDILLNGEKRGSGFFSVSQKPPSRAKVDMKLTPFSIARRINDLIVRGAAREEYLPCFNEKTQKVIKIYPWFLDAFLSDLEGGIEVIDLIPDGPNYIVKTKGGRTIYLERIGTEEDFRIDLVSH